MSIFTSTIFVLRLTNICLDFSCRTRLKTVELERDRTSHEVTKVLISSERRISSFFLRTS